MMQAEALVSVCDRELRRFYEAIDGLQLETREDKKCAIWQMTAKLFKLEFVYLKKGGIMHAPSVLYTRIYPRKNDTMFFLPHELLTMVSPAVDFDAAVFPYIENEERMVACTAELCAVLEALFPLLEELAINEERYQALKQQKTDEIFRVLKVKAPSFREEDYELAEEYYQDLYELHESAVVVFRLTAPDASPYLQLADGKRNKAQKEYEKLEKKGNLTAYEQGLLTRLREKPDFQPYPADCDAAGALQPFVGSAAIGKWVLWSVFVCYLVFAAVFCGVFFLLELILSANTVFFAGVTWAYGLILSGLPGLFGGLALHRIFPPIWYGRKKQAALAADRMVNGKGTAIFAYVVFGLVAVLTVLLSANLVIYGNLACYDTQLTYYEISEGSLPKKRVLGYTDATKVYRIEGRYNDYGDLISRASYVICFADGTQLDLDGYTSLETTEQALLPLLTPHTGAPVVLASDRDLPKK